MTSNFATRYKKDLSTEALKTKLVRRKSVLQKESRQKQFNKTRQFGLADVNTQHTRDRELSRLEETGEAHSPEKSKGKPNQITNAKICSKERLEMLQRYKAEKELRKLKEQREKPVFKCGRYKPEMPSFLPQPSQIPVLSKPKEKAAPLPERVTRSKARPQASTMVPKGTGKGSGLQPPQHRHVEKPAKKESKGAQPAVPAPTSGRITRATAAAMSKIPQVLKPAVTAGNQAQKRVTRKGKPQTEIKNEEALHDMKEDVPMEPIEERADLQLASAEGTGESEASPEKENVLPVSCVPALPRRRGRSFAPQNFLFKPLEGVASYKISPLSPSRASMFLSPNLTWSPAKTTRKVPKEDAKEPTPEDRRSESEPSTVPDVTEDIPECQSALEPQEEEEMEPAPNETTMAITGATEATQRPADLSAPETSDTTGAPQHDVRYFRNVLRSETERLSLCCLEWDGTAETDIPDDAQDLVRTTVGQTRLLIAERFKQFEGLVDNCEFRRGEKETTCSDLDGFWDMVAFQVEDVNKKFESLRKLQENGWQAAEGNQEAKQVPKKKTACPRATRVTGRSVGRTAARKRLAAIKAMMKNKARQEGAAAEPAGQETPQKEEEPVTFDGGFFRVESPARLLLGQTPKSATRSSRRSSRRATPRSASRAFLRSCVDTSVARLGTPAAYRSHPPLPNPDAFAGLSRTDLSHIFDQSDTQAAEGSSAAVDGAAEEAGETQTASSDSASRSSETDNSDPVDSREAESPDTETNESDIAEDVQQTVVDLGVACTPDKDVRGTESLDAEKNESNITEEAQQTTMDLGGEGVMCSPEKDIRGPQSPDTEKNRSDMAEEVQQTTMDLGDEGSLCSPEKDFGGTESPNAEKNESDMAEEVQQTTMDLGDEGLLCSPEKDFRGTESPNAETNESIIAEEIQRTTMDLGDEGSLCSPEKDVWGAESPDAGKHKSDMAEEVQQTTMDLGDEGSLCSPEKDALFEGASFQGEEHHTPARQTGPLLDDSSCSSGTPVGKPHLDCSLFFTPLKNEAQKFAAVAPGNDLIVFSPLPFPAGEK
ncbi:PREDICTED: disks large-associated protein 5 [Gekko japonicus]|uniref:Disks large-associated protein 5 n=1 Tax=Gekko japonicus TaxID=146911 RepID=A0ABM1K1J5_GEKJA|nr:PREDICTED: disks large-associated protein 5 [Gekko japonicus]XP_015267583.1 PREDICTED: disks large-associated protein 5 [Gekko japonicus]